MPRGLRSSICSVDGCQGGRCITVRAVIVVSAKRPEEQHLFKRWSPRGALDCGGSCHRGLHGEPRSGGATVTQLQNRHMHVERKLRGVVPISL